MRILMKVHEHIRDQNSTPDTLALALFQTAKMVYNDDCPDPEAYLHQPDNDAPYAQELELLDGAVNPEGLTNLARSWNNDIANTMEKALATILATQVCDGPARWLAAPPNQVYDLKTAVMALDGDFYAFADQALLVNEAGFTTMLKALELNYIIQHPEQYAAITVWPK